jgi:GNAT superfamily N-acetyltransferase
MPDEIRRATAADAPAISSVKAAVWPGDAVDSGRIARVIASESHATHVAVCNGAVVGFVDGFPTISCDGLCRWEVDLLAVRPDFRGQGIGVQLIAASRGRDASWR